MILVWVWKRRGRKSDLYEKSKLLWLVWKSKVLFEFMTNTKINCRFFDFSFDSFEFYDVFWFLLSLKDSIFGQLHLELWKVMPFALSWGEYYCISQRKRFILQHLKCPGRDRQKKKTEKKRFDHWKEYSSERARLFHFSQVHSGRWKLLLILYICCSAFSSRNESMMIVRTNRMRLMINQIYWNSFIDDTRAWYRLYFSQQC